ncbi:ATP-binding protein [Litoribrevibacter euphylliae]|uniref:histidine kinase n=1 Tax=Litoribrevibacter euphylliae TaxID=1834034 RepID=A0ABV7HKN8_9GAMM
MTRSDSASPQNGSQNPRKETAKKSQASIRNKIQYSLSLFSLMVIIVSSLTFAWSANKQFHRSTQDELSVLTSVIAGNSQASVAFNDVDSATNILSGIKENSNILSATLYKNGVLFAVFPVDSEPLKEAGTLARVWFDDPFYYATHPIKVNNKVIGTLILKSKLNDWEGFRERLLLIILGLLVTILLMAVITSHWIKKHVTIPLQALSDWATDVYSSKNFNSRAEKHGNDEIGKLADNLNNMLAELSKQESIISLNRDLEAEIAFRKETEQELISLRDKAEQANRSKSMFLANMSHEIRTPMNAIIGFVDVVLEDELSNDQRKHLCTVRQSAKDLHNLLNEILDVAKMEEGKLELETVPFSVPNVINHVVKTLEFKAQEKNIQMIQRIPDNLPAHYLGDPLRLNQILMNLIGNAIKFTETGSITVAVDRLDNGDLKFLVRDTGIGIPKDKVDHIFESFNQADASTNRKYGGTGLGTTISKQLVTLMNGKIWVESEEGVGSSFYFTVRLEETDEVISEKIDTINSSLLETNQPLHILVAEDMQQNADLLRIRLEGLGHQITHAINGVEAVKQMESNCVFDMILMDIQMPEMDGLEATKNIRMLDNGKSIPIIALTASVMHEDRKACTDAGMNGFVKKPIVFNDLFEEMSRLMTTQFEVPDDRTVSANNVLGITDTPIIDFKLGIDTWGDTKVFIDNLKSFSERHEQALEQLVGYWKNNQEKEAKESLHALRGITGNLALSQLYDKLQQTSIHIKHHGLTKLDNIIEELTQSFCVTLETIKDLEHNQEQSFISLEGVTVSAFMEDALRLKDTLLGGELDEDLVDACLSHLTCFDVPMDEIKSFQRAIDNFDFETAGQELEVILSRINIGGEDHESERYQP